MIGYLVLPRSKNTNFPDYILQPEDVSDTFVVHDRDETSSDSEKGVTGQDFDDDKMFYICSEGGEDSYNSLYDFFRNRYPENRDGFIVDLPNNLKYIKELRWFTRWLIVKSGGSSTDAYKFEIMVDELCLNAFEHGAESAPVYFCFTNESGKVSITVKNYPEKELDMEKIKNKLHNFDDSGAYMSEKGRGLFIVKNLTDEFTVVHGVKGLTTARAVKIIDSRK